ncbi:MAG: phosphonopyruvate decarboxylase [Candidatus Margulisbacteria bacterium]|nr:phosphonopyruvate decarboxylase [Candidatus Margulisiibacteriota bacterium]
MIPTQSFGDALNALGYGFFSGVPCSSLKNLINMALNDRVYVSAANEGDAVAVSTGAILGGQKACVLMQNSGLGNAVSPLTSLNHTFNLPILGFVSLRGEPGTVDEPQHALMGEITQNMLGLMNIQSQILSQNIETAKSQLKEADEMISSGASFFFIVKKGTFEEVPLRSKPVLDITNKAKKVSKRDCDSLTRKEVLTSLIEKRTENTILLATTGYTGRELHDIEDHEQHLYMAGSMGCVSSLGLGLALTQKERDVMVIDGDGACLMRMGAMATVAHYSPPNLCHILIDNGVHDSTGGQQTVSNHIHFVDIAAACGYQTAVFVHSIDELKAAITEWQAHKGLTFIHIKTKPGQTGKLGRPIIQPPEVAKRLQRYLS